jgi:hypothetical protein
MPENIIINGQHLVLHGITGNAGDKNAVASITVPVEFPDLLALFSITAAEVAAAVGIGGLVCTDRPFSQLEHGGYEVRFQFEGFNSEVSFEQGEELCSYSFDTDMGEEPIETHPKFHKLKDEYGPLVDGKFPDTYTPKAGGGSTALAKNDGKGAKSNPLAGLESWLKAGGVFSRSYAVSRVPTDIYKGIGTLVDYPPGAEKLNIPRFKKRKWLKLPPIVQSGDKGAGSAARVTERYRLSGATTGSEAILYDQGQLED